MLAIQKSMALGQPHCSTTVNSQSIVFAIHLKEYTNEVSSCGMSETPRAAADRLRESCVKAKRQAVM